MWGDDPKYTVGALRNADLAMEFYPDWECWFYCAKDTPEKILTQLEKKKNCKIIRFDEPGQWKFAVKRFTAISEKDVERVIFRDCDSRFTKREVAAVNEWIESGKVLHVMKDHPYHGGFPILAGMFGLSNKFNFDMNTMLSVFEATRTDSNYYHYDQMFLSDFVWRFYFRDCVYHDEIFKNLSKGSEEDIRIPFPIKREGLEYIGEPLNQDDLPCEPHHREVLRDFLENNHG